MLRLFKQGSLIAQWLVILILLAISAFIYFPSQPCKSESLLSLCSLFAQRELASGIFAILLSLLIVILSSLVIRSARLIGFTSFLPSLLSVMLIFFLSPRGLNPDKAAVLVILAFAMMQLFRRQEREEGLQQVFLASFLFSLAAMVHPAAAGLIVIPPIYLLIFRSYQWRQWLVIPFGLLLPQLFLFTYLFWFDMGATMLNYYAGLIKFDFNIHEFFQGYGVIVLPVTALGVVIAVFMSLVQLSEKKIQVRAQMSLIATLLIFCAAIGALLGTDSFFLMILPFVWLFSIRMLESRSKRLPVVMLTLIFAAFIGSIIFHPPSWI